MFRSLTMQYVSCSRIVEPLLTTFRNVGGSPKQYSIGLPSLDGECNTTLRVRQHLRPRTARRSCLWKR